MNSTNHQKYQFGIFYPSNIHGVGSPRDLLTFFEAIRLVSDQPEKDYPFLWSLRRKPVFGADMLVLFDEAQNLRVRMTDVPATNGILLKLDLVGKVTKLKTEAQDLAGVFIRIFFLLADDAPEVVNLRMKKPDNTVLDRGSVRLGPIEPLIPSEFFAQLPESAFDEVDPPLWLRDEIFDEGFYTGKI